MRHIKHSSKWVSLVVILPLFWKGITCQLLDYSITVDSPVRVQEGLCVTIPCSFTADNRNTFRNSFGLWIQSSSNPNYVVATNHPFTDTIKQNFYLTGNPDAGDCTLTITDARKEDAGTYYFRFVESKYSSVKYSYSRDKTITIIVDDLTDEPVVSDPGTVIAGRDVTLTCAPPRNCSTTSLVFQWKKSNVDGIWKNSPSVKFTPSTNDDQKTITCEMKNSRGKTTKKTINLHVCCLPDITNTWEINEKKNTKQDHIEVVEGSSVILRCSVQSNLTLNVAWTDGNNTVLQHGTAKELELRLENMTMEDTGTYTCSASTDYVMNSANISVNVQYRPRNMEIMINSSKGGELPASQRVDIDQTERLTLVCRVDSNPSATVVWIKGEVDTDKSKMSNTELEAMINVTSSMVDVYRCLAWNALGFIERRIQVGAKQGQKAESGNSGKISYWEIVVAFGCGIGITILIILLYKLIIRKRMTKKKNYVKAEEPSASAEPPMDEIYMNVSKAEHKAEEAAENNRQLDSTGFPSEEDLHYSTISFTAEPSKMPSSHPETEYAEIQVK